MPRKARTWNQYPPKYMECLETFRRNGEAQYTCASAREAIALRHDFYRWFNALYNACEGATAPDPLAWRYLQLGRAILIQKDDKHNGTSVLTFKLRPMADMPSQSDLQAGPGFAQSASTPLRNTHSSTPSLASDGKLHFATRADYEAYCRDECELGSTDYVIDSEDAKTP